MAEVKSAEEKVTVASLREPPGYVTDAMAAEGRASEKRNGHGRYAYKDMWIAGIDALLKGKP